MSYGSESGVALLSEFAMGQASCGSLYLTCVEACMTEVMAIMEHVVVQSSDIICVMNISVAMGMYMLANSFFK
jgi:hypothetical protein